MPRRAELPNLYPARMDVTYYRGDSLSMRLRMQSQGLPVDITGWTWRAWIRTVPDGIHIADFTVFHDEGNGGDELNGIIRVVLPHQRGRDLPGTCIWDLEATEHDLGGEELRVRTVLRGYIYTTGDVTNQDVIEDTFLAPQITRGGV